MYCNASFFSVEHAEWYFFFQFSSGFLVLFTLLDKRKLILLKSIFLRLNSIFLMGFNSFYRMCVIYSNKSKVKERHTNH